LSSACFISLILCEASFAANCASVQASNGDCTCGDASGNQSYATRSPSDNSLISQWDVLQCSDASDTTCAAVSDGSTNSTSPQYYKNTSGTGYYKCDWTPGTGNGFSNGQLYTLVVAPTLLTATVASATEINLSWADNSANETGFKVFKNGTLLHTTAADATSYSATGLTCNTPYTFTVKATDSVSGADSAAAVTTPPTTTTSACSTPPPVNAPIDLHFSKQVETFATEIEIK